MIFTLTINPETLETICTDSTVTINFVKKDNGSIVCEISKPDDEMTQLMTGPGITWQQ